jgi:4-diphosphocytidyl-2-C-methyl-D-erythritol kinase
MMSGATAVRSHAKINLGLYIGAPRADGFHSLTTVYQTLALHDVVTVRARAAAATCIRLTSNDGRVPTDGRNTAWKMVELALGALGLTADVEIHIDKRLPVQGGLGAGSANAVAALVGLEVELGMGDELCGAPGLKGERWGTGLSQVSKSRPGAPAGPSTPLRFAQDDKPGFAQDDKPGFAQDDKPGFAQDDKAIEEFDQECKEAWGGWRLEIAARVGSDVPLFLIGGTVLGLDRGQAVSPLPEIEPVWCVVATPDVGVSTAQAFRDWDALCGAEGLTAEASADRLNELSRAYASAFSGANDFSGSIPGGGQGAGSSGVLLHEEDLAGPNESALVRTGITSWIENDFERVVFRQHPSLSEIKRVLAASGRPEAALYASLSGSGSALYGLYRTRGDAEAACRRLGSAGVRSLLTRTLPRAKYWREMLLRKD